MSKELYPYYLFVYSKDMVQIACDWGYFRNQKQAMRSAEQWMKRLNGYYCHAERCYV